VARFYIGQPVVCINDRRGAFVRRNFPLANWIKKGARYTIRENMTARMPNGVLTFVTLREVHNPYVAWHDGQFMEMGFWEERFEPATDIGEFDETRKKVGEWGKSSDWDRKVKRRVRRKEDA
jgi:hypothetical protein